MQAGSAGTQMLCSHTSLSAQSEFVMQPVSSSSRRSVVETTWHGGHPSLPVLQSNLVVLPLRSSSRRPIGGTGSSQMWCSPHTRPFVQSALIMQPDRLSSRRSSPSVQTLCRHQPNVQSESVMHPVPTSSRRPYLTGWPSSSSHKPPSQKSWVTPSGRNPQSESLWQMEPSPVLSKRQ